jgi:hypothetical protein
MREFLCCDGCVVGRGHARHANVGWIKFDVVDNVLATGFETINGVAPVMFRSRPKIPSAGSVD